MKFIMKKSVLSAAILVLPLMGMGGTASAGAEPFIGEMSYVGFNFPPRNYASCDGQLIAISQNTALYSLLGTMYGGDGRTTFALPDMRGRVPIHKGQLPGGSYYAQGRGAGSEYRKLTIAQMPSHNHTATVNSTNTVTGSVTSTLHVKNSNSSPTARPEGNSFGKSTGTDKIYSTAAPDVALNAASITTDVGSIIVTTNNVATVANNGQSDPFSIIQPFTVLNCIIAVQGIFPSRQ